MCVLLCFNSFFIVEDFFPSEMNTTWHMEIITVSSAKSPGLCQRSDWASGFLDRSAVSEVMENRMAMGGRNNTEICVSFKITIYQSNCPHLILRLNKKCKVKKRTINHTKHDWFDEINSIMFSNNVNILRHFIIVIWISTRQCSDSLGNWWTEQHRNMCEDLKDFFFFLNHDISDSLRMFNT